MNSTQQQQIQKYAQVVQKCWEDADFKKRLIDNPISTLEELMGKSLNIPDGKTLVVRDQTDDSNVYINIPPIINQEELTKEQLKDSTGGRNSLSVSKIF